MPSGPEFQSDFSRTGGHITIFKRQFQSLCSKPSYNSATRSSTWSFSLSFIVTLAILLIRQVLNLLCDLGGNSAGGGSLGLGGPHISALYPTEPHCQPDSVFSPSSSLQSSCPQLSSPGTMLHQCATSPGPVWQSWMVTHSDSTYVTIRAMLSNKEPL